MYDSSNSSRKEEKRKHKSSGCNSCSGSSSSSDGKIDMRCQPCIIQVPPGPQGPAGPGMLSGSGPPDPGYGKSGDTYTDLTTGTVYKNIDGQWIPTAESLKGDKGDKGDPGPPLCGAFGRMYIDYLQGVTYNLTVNWTPVDTIDWIIDYNSFNVSLVQNTTYGFSMLQVNLDGVYEVVFDASFNTQSIYFYRLVSTTSGPINGTNAMDDGGDDGTLRVGCSTMIWAPAGTAFYAEGRTSGNGSWGINYASLSVKMLSPNNTFTVAP